jgi:hypothetical protein
VYDDWFNRRQRRKLQAEAIRFAANGWPVVRLAMPSGGLCPCGNGCLDPHPAGETIHHPFLVEAAWAGSRGWGLGLVTEEFDVVELPAEYGALLNHRLKDTCPTAMAPLRRRWWFFLVPGSIPAAQVASVGGVLRSGPDEWVPAPGTRLETTGRIRWLVHPYLTGWRPYERRDPIDQVFR